MVRRRVFSLVSAVSGDFFSSHGRSSAGDVPFVGAEPRRLRLKS